MKKKIGNKKSKEEKMVIAIQKMIDNREYQRCIKYAR
jgi:hypothetical protein